MALKNTVNSEVIDSPCSKTFHQTPSLPSQNVSYLAVDHAHSVCFQGQPQKKGISPCIPKRKIKDVKGVFCASQCLFAPHVPNVPNVVPSLAVGGRLQKFWQVWLSLGANPRVVSILREGYTLPFKIRPPLTRSPVIKSGYAHPGKSKDRPHKQVGSRKGGHQILPGLLQPPLSSTKTEPEMETYLGPQPSQSLFETRHLQNGNSGNHKVVSPKGGVGNVAGFQRRLPSYPYQSEITEVPQVFSGKKSLSIHGPSFRARHSSTGIHQGSQGGETDGSSTGYLDPPVPRRLVSQSPGPGNLPVTYPDPLGPVPRTRVGGKHGEIGTYTSTGFQFRRLPVRPAVWSSVAHSGQMDRSSAETTVHQRQGLLFSPSVHVPHRVTYCHGKASVGRPASHETGAVASKKTLACAGEPGEDYSGSPFSSPTPGLVVGRDQCAKRATLAPSSARPTDFYRRLKRRLGRTLRGIHSKRRLVRTRKSPPHQLLGTQGSSSGSQEFREAVQGTDCSHSN